MDDLLGVLVGLLAALTWATVSVAFASLSPRFNIMAMNFWRCLSAAIFTWLIIPFRLAEGFPSLSVVAIVALVGSVVLALILGDSLYFKSLGTIGVARAVPLTNVYPLLSAVIAVSFLGEVLSLPAVAGIAAVLVGVYLIAFPRHRLLAHEKGVPRDSIWTGVSLALAAAAFWAVSTALLKISVDELDPVVVNAIRLPVAAVLLLFVVLWRHELPHPKEYGRKSLMLLLGTGVLGLGIGGLLFLVALSLAGAARTATIVSASPLFATPLSMLFLGEKITIEVVGGSILTIIGIWLITM